MLYPINMYDCYVKEKNLNKRKKRRRRRIERGVVKGIVLT
jgi:hypothetical protein